MAELRKKDPSYHQDDDCDERTPILEEYAATSAGDSKAPHKDATSQALKDQQAMRAHRGQIFGLLFITTAVMRMDMGLIPALSTTLTAEFEMTDLAYGSLGSLVYFGATIGSFIAIPVLDQLPTKLVLLVCVLMHIVCLLIFSTADYYYAWASARLFSGVAQVMYIIFLPVWIDSFAPKDTALRWMATSTVANPLGLLLGYGAAASIVSFIDSEFWWTSFYGTAGILVILFVILCFVDSSSIDVKRHLAEKQSKSQQAQNGAPGQAQQANLVTLSEFSASHREPGVEDFSARYQRIRKDMFNKELALTTEMTFANRVIHMMTKVDFMNYMLLITVKFFVGAGIQFWITDYFVNVLGVKQEQAYEYFFVCGALGPVAGIVTAGFAFQKVGGYLGPDAVKYILIANIAGAIFAVASVFCYSPLTASIFIMLELFCGTFIMPAACGIMLNQVSPDMRTMANSFANFCYNLIGHLPAPLVYGYFQQKFKADWDHVGLFSLQVFTVLAIGFTVVANIRNRKFIRDHVMTPDYVKELKTGSSESRQEADEPTQKAQI